MGQIDKTGKVEHIDCIERMGPSRQIEHVEHMGQIEKSAHRTNRRHTMRQREHIENTRQIKQVGQSRQI